MFRFPIILDDTAAKPLYVQLYEALKEAIRAGQLKPGEIIPSTRLVAAKLGIARQTVLQSLEQLRNDGLIASIDNGKLIVNSTKDGADPRTDMELASEDEDIEALPVELSEFALRMRETADVQLLPVMWRGIRPENLPVQQWKRALNKEIKDNVSLFTENTREPTGVLALRQALCDYVLRTRALECEPQQVVIFTGTPGAVDAIARLVLNPGDWVAVENPGYRFARRTLLMHAAGLLPVPVDEDGMQVAQLKEAIQPIKLVYVTPSHNDPTGAVMPPSRRLDLLNWAQETNALIVEDDYDHFYRYTSRPQPALAAMDKLQSTIYVSTFWQILFPMVRMGFAIFPRAMMPYMRSFKAQLEPDPQVLEQHALAAMLNEGLLERHIKRTSANYAKTRLVAMQTLTRVLGGRVWVPRESAGLHLLVRFRMPALNDADIMRLARDVELPIVSTATHYIGAPMRGEFLLPFAFMEESELIDAITRFGELARLRETV